MRTLTLVCLTSALALALVPAPAQAMHGDIVVDNLVYSGVQYPVEPVSADAQRRLGRLRGALSRQGLDVVVAFATTESDAGKTPDLYSRPQEYANDLGRRIDAFRRRIEPTARLRPARVVVVTPYGLGASGLPDDAVAAARSVPVARDSSGTEVAAAGGLALQRVAAVAGVRAPALFRRAELGPRPRVPWAPLAVIVVLVAAGVGAGLKGRPTTVTAA